MSQNLTASSLQNATAFAVRIGAFCILMILCSHIALPLPWTPVPFTLQPLGVILTGLLLSPGAAAATLVLYLGLGAAGFPVFAPVGPGGLAAFFGPTGGYLAAYPVAAYAASLVYSCLRRKGHFLAADTAGLAGISLIYASGAIWLKAVTGQSWHGTFLAAVYPFVGADLAKIAIAAALARKLPSFR